MSALPTLSTARITNEKRLIRKFLEKIKIQNVELPCDLAYLIPIMTKHLEEGRQVYTKLFQIHRLNERVNRGIFHGLKESLTKLEQMLTRDTTSIRNFYISYGETRGRDILKTCIVRIREAKSYLAFAEDDEEVIP